MAELADIQTTTREFLALAAHHLAVGDVDQAEQTARAILKIAPRSAAGWHMLGDVLSLSPGKRGEASDAYHKALALDPDDMLAVVAKNDLSARATLSPNKGAKRSLRRERDMQLPHLAPQDGKERLITEARAAEARGDWLAARKAWESVLEIDSSDTWAWSQYGHLLSVNLQQYEDAEKAFRRAIEEDPTDDWAWGKLGIMLADFLGRVEEGQGMLSRAISLDPGECYYRGWLGWSLYRQSEDFEAAENQLEEAVRLWPDYQWAFFHLGVVRMELGDRPKKAEQALKRAEMLDPNDVPTLYALASLYEEQLRRPRKALRAYERLTALVPGDPLALRAMGMLYQSALGEPERAVALYEKALEIDPRDFDVLTRLGWVKWEVLGKVDEGLRSLEAAVECASDSAWVATHLGQALFHGKQDYAKAEQWFRKAIELDADYDWAHAMLGSLASEHLDDVEAGLHHLREAVRISPDYAFAWARLGRLALIHEKDDKLAWQALNKAIELSPSAVDALTDVVWMGVYRVFRADLVEQHAVKLVSIDGDNAYARTLLAIVIRQTGGDIAEALEECRKAVALAPDDHYPWHVLGDLLLYDFGDLEAAEEALLKAESLEHACPSTFSDIGLIRYATGRERDARHYFEHALEQDDTCATAWRAFGCFLFYSAEDVAMAEGAFERAIELETENFEGWALLAALLDRLEERQQESNEILNKAIELAPDGLDVELWAARLLEPLVLRR